MVRTPWLRPASMDAAAHAEVAQSLKDLSPGKKVVLSQAFPERILHVLEASNLPDEEWASTTGAFYVPLKGKKATDQYHFKRQAEMYADELKTLPLEIVEREKIVIPKPLTYQEQALITAYSPPKASRWGHSISPTKTYQSGVSPNRPRTSPQKQRRSSSSPTMPCRPGTSPTKQRRGTSPTKLHRPGTSPTRQRRSRRTPKKKTLEQHTPKKKPRTIDKTAFQINAPEGDTFFSKQGEGEELNHFTSSTGEIDSLYFFKDFAGLHPLKSIDLSGCAYDVTPEVLTFLSSDTIRGTLEELVLKNVITIAEEDACFIFSQNPWPILSVLDISNTSFGGDFFLREMSSNCPSLTELNCAGTSVSDEGIITLAHYCVQLKKLSVAKCSKVSNYSLKKLIDIVGKRSVNALEALDVSGHMKHVDDSVLVYALSNAKGLKTLSASNNENITDIVFSGVDEKYASALQNIRLRNCRGIQGMLLGGLALTQHLHTLDLSNCASICDEHLETFAKNRKLCRQLIHVSFRKCKLSDNGAAPLFQHCKCLKHVDLAFCSMIGSKTVDALAKSTSWLHTACFEGCKQLSGKSISKLASKNAYCLKKLTLGTGNRINGIGRNTFEDNIIHFDDSTGIRDGVARLKSVVTIDLSGMFRLGDDIVDGFTTGPMGLKHLYLSGCSGLSTDALTRILHASTSLQTFNVACLHTSVVDDVFFQYREIPSTRLQHIVLRNCDGLTNAGLYSLSRCPFLREVDVSGCNQLTEIGLSFLVQKCTRLESLNVQGLERAMTPYVLYQMAHLDRLYYANLTKCIKIDAAMLQKYLDDRTWPYAELASASHSAHGTNHFGLQPRLGVGYLKTKFRVEEYHNCVYKATVKIQSHVRRKFLIRSVVRARKRERRKQAHLAALREEEIRNQAAARIQWAFEQFVRSQRVRKIRLHLYMAEQDKKLRTEMVIRIQRYWRSRFLRFALASFFERRKTNATIIQKYVRGKFFRSRYCILRDRTVQAVVRIQGLFRMTHAKIIFTRQKVNTLIWRRRRQDASSKIQKGFRAYRTRNILRVFRKKIERTRAKQIYVWYAYHSGRIRGKLQRSKVRKEYTASAITLQCFARSCFAYKVLLRKQFTREKFIFETFAATQIQKIFRGFSDRKFTSIMLADWKQQVAAVSLVQRVFRGFQCRKRSRAIRMAIAEEIRCKEAYEKMRSHMRERIAAHTWQLVHVESIRRAMTPANLKIRRAVRIWAALKIQRSYRIFVNRAAFAAVSHWRKHQAALVIQRIHRGRRVKAFAKSMSSLFCVASVIIQRAYLQYRRRRMLLMIQKAGQTLVHRERLRRKKLMQEEQKKKVIERIQVQNNCSAAVIVQRHHKHRMKHKKERERHEEMERIERLKEKEMQEKIAAARSRYNLEEQLIKEEKRGFWDGFFLNRRFKINLKKQPPPLVTKRAKRSFIDKIKDKVIKSRRAEQEQQKKRGLVYSVYTHQKTVIGLNGLTDFHVTIGEAETEAFGKKQHVNQLAHKPYFVKLGDDLTLDHRNSTGALQPQNCFFWGEFQLCPLYQQFTDIRIEKLMPSSISKVDVSRHRLSLVAEGVRIISHKRLPFELHLRKRQKGAKAQAKPIMKFMISSLSRHDDADMVNMKKDGYECIDDMDVGALLDDIDDQKKKTSDFIDIDKGCRLWIKRLSATEFHNKRLKDAKTMAGSLYRGTEEQKAMLLNTVEFTGLGDEHVVKIHRAFQEIGSYAAAVAKIQMTSETQSVFVDDILLYMGEKRTKLTDLIFQFMGFDVGLSIEAETMDFASFFTFVTKFCSLGKRELVRFLFFSMAAFSRHDDMVHRAHVTPLIHLIRSQYPRSVSAQQVRKVTKAFRLPAADNVEFGKFGKQLGLGNPDMSLSEFVDLDRRFPSLFQPLYKFHENFTEKFLGKHFWRAHKHAFNRARGLVSADRAEEFFCDSDETSSSEDSVGEDEKQ